MGWVLALALGCGEAPPTAARAGVPPDPAAIVLVIDGVRTDELVRDEVSDLTGAPGTASAPELWRTVAPEALTCRELLATAATITAPAHAALLTGVPEAYANFPADAGVGPYRPVHPTLFEAAREGLGLGEDDAVLVANTNLLEGLTGSVGATLPAAWADLVGADGGVADDGAVFDELRRRIDAGPPRLLVANLHDVDRAGHNQTAEDYLTRIARVDARIADLWTWIREEHPSYAASVLFVVTSDHGRHRSDVPDAWQNHGDGCRGCRETPLFLVGGGATGELAEAPFALDLPPTIAAHLGVPLPWAEGLPLDGGAARSGEADVATDGALVVTRRFRDDPLARAEIVVDGAPLSSSAALDAAAPAALDASFGRVACWRELVEDGDALPWVPRCAADLGAGWEALDFPAEELGPYDAVALAEQDGRLVAAWTENPGGAADTDESWLVRAEWSPAAGWSAPVATFAPFPTDPALAVTDAPVVAFATNLEGADARFTRRVRVLVGDTAVDLVDGERLERPALASDGAAVRLAALRIAEDGATVVTAASADGGRTWSALAALPGAASPRVRPAWDGDTVVWIDGDRLCRARPGDADAACVAAGSDRVRALSADGAAIIRDDGVGAWTLAEAPR